MNTLKLGGKTVSVFSADMPGTPVVYLNTVSGEGRAVFEAARDAGCPPFTLVEISNLNWNRDMAPWDSPPVFRDSEPCVGGADDHLRLLVEEIIPSAEEKIPGDPVWRGIVGYSLAGLFALYALCLTEVFSRAGSISGSLWFPGAKEFFLNHEPKRRPDCIYFSLGDRESKTRNPVLKRVAQNTQELHAFYRARGIDTVLQMNPGNHRDHAVERTAAGISWLLSR